MKSVFSCFVSLSLVSVAFGQSDVVYQSGLADDLQSQPSAQETLSEDGGGSSLQIDNADHIKTMIQKGNDINTMDEHGWTALLYAASFCNTELVEQLLAAGADAAHRANDSWTAAHSACAVRSQEVDVPDVDTVASDIIRRLVAAGARAGATDARGRTPLMIAAGNDGSIKRVQTLLELGAQTEELDDQENSALIYAACTGNRKVVDLLLAQPKPGKRPSADLPCVCAALFKAVQKNDPAPILSLHRAGVDVNLRDSEGHSPLDLARTLRHDAVAEALISCGARGE